MKILAKDLTVCKKCYRLKGYVLEEYNGIVPVFCICELLSGLNHIIETSIVGGVIADGSVHLMWKPISDHKESDGTWWHTPHFAGFGFAGGKKQDYKKLISWIKQSDIPGIRPVRKTYE